MASTDTFRGYPTSLLVSVKHMGKAILGDDALYGAAQAYSDPARGGGNFGPAILAEDCSVSVTPASVVKPKKAAATAPSEPPAKTGKEDETTDPWAGYEIHDLKALMKEHGVVGPRVLTPGKAIELLEAAGVKPT
jgi:hypothetical protein